ncbi:hypothetical protein EGR_08165 [Echinococcus granulosus]|uniref:Uncharacterized protein n=1 Tax=Echinococcus granulosus TaxID=6210 RepID=W6UUF6_ECHGR|nr:hypothetical protein EGR_08165 [Echinococcus granulosus]EUB57014.1 hypothetical protein EGR_08165 [Echinococcus granulosus]
MVKMTLSNNKTNVSRSPTLSYDILYVAMGPHCYIRIATHTDATMCKKVQNLLIEIFLVDFRYALWALNIRQNINKLFCPNCKNNSAFVEKIQGGVFSYHEDILKFGCRIIIKYTKKKQKVVKNQ